MWDVVRDGEVQQVGHFLTVPQFTARFGPTQADYDAVVKFAGTSGGVAHSTVLTFSVERR